MKRFIPYVVAISTLFLVFLAVIVVLGERDSKEIVKTGDRPPTIILAGNSYIAPHKPISKLPDNYEYCGTLSDEEANDTGLAGCKYYALTDGTMNDIYVYQELAPHFDESSGEIIRSKWAYVHWISTTE